jgi:hypothetical protein
MLSQSLQADVADVAFAPTMGRSTMLLAVGCTDGALFLFRVSVKCVVILMPSCLWWLDERNGCLNDDADIRRLSFSVPPGMPSLFQS